LIRCTVSGLAPAGCAGGEVITVLMSSIIGMMSLGQGATFSYNQHPDSITMRVSLPPMARNAAHQELA
jgi:hypothetical protein